VNVPRIKGSHNAMKTGMLAAEAVVHALAQDRSADTLTDYETSFESSWVYQDLDRVKNVKPMWSKLGLVGGVALGAADMWLRTIAGFGFGTWRHGKPDSETLKTAALSKPIAYPKPDGVISFDRLTNIAFSATNHKEDQPVHLQLRDKAIPISRNLVIWDEPAQRYCPAGVYEVVREEGKEPRFQINHQNCVHCKTCDIKDPSQNINWVVPQGGEGPNYPNM
jgi:electron-transferring-flavoprotein dehydrogenase